jgi:outer membrane lipoprotein SlyB
MRSARFLPLIPAAALALGGCSNLAGISNMSTYYDGTITGIEVVELDGDDSDSSLGSLLGGIGGALLGNYLDDHGSTGTIVGGVLGAAAGSMAGSAFSGGEGLRLAIDSENGPMAIDVPFNCNLRPGQRVRIIAYEDSGEVQYYMNGSFHTITEDSPSQCRNIYDQFCNGVGYDPYDQGGGSHVSNYNYNYNSNNGSSSSSYSYSSSYSSSSSSSCGGSYDDGGYYDDDDGYDDGSSCQGSYYDDSGSSCQGSYYDDDDGYQQSSDSEDDGLNFNI